MKFDSRKVFYLELVIFTAMVATVAARPRQRRILDLRSAPVSNEPTQPKEFQSVDELSQYLDNLAEYYKMMSRPRSVHTILVQLS